MRSHLGCFPPAVLSAMVVHSYSDFNLHIPANFLVLLTVMAVGHAALHLDERGGRPRLLKKALEAEGGFEVLTATDGKTGLALAKREKPDLILLDIMMPDIFGTQVAEELLETPATRAIPIIFVTCIVRESELEKTGGMIGNRVFIAKPIVIEKLLEKIDSLLPGAPAGV